MALTQNPIFSKTNVRKILTRPNCFCSQHKMSFGVYEERKGSRKFEEKLTDEKMTDKGEKALDDVVKHI